MKPSEATQLLALAAGYDKRTVGTVDAIAWADALRGLNVADCAEAIRQHYATTTDYLMPAHVRSAVRKIRNERLRAVPSTALEPADVDPNDLEAYQRARLRLIRRIADGKPLPIEPQLPARPVRKLAATTLAALPQIPHVDVETA